jgi:hypothetical protein
METCVNTYKAKSNIDILPSQGNVAFELFAAVELFMEMEPFIETIEAFNAAKFVAFPIVALLLPLQ